MNICANTELHLGDDIYCCVDVYMTGCLIQTAQEFFCFVVCYNSWNVGYACKSTCLQNNENLGSSICKQVDLF